MYENYLTEQRNCKTRNIDQCSTLELVTLINDEDKTVPYAIEKVLADIATAIDQITPRIQSGGRLVYIGAGTSGRLGVVDASECPPTYGVSPEMVQGIIAGGRDAMFRSVENAEDNAQAGEAALQAINFCEKDVCFGISASGSAEYVKGALRYADSLGALTVALSCNPCADISKAAALSILPVVGAEVVSGSTRMKSGTAQKLVLNMISTGVMIKLGRVHGNLLVHMRPTNKKLIDRAERIICDETGADRGAAAAALRDAGYDISAAIAALRKA